MTVAASDPVEVAAVVSAKHGAILAGVGQASGTAVSPDVWIPDSSTWLLRLKTGGAAAFEPGNGSSIASSPVVVAMPEPIATRLGWPQQELGWTDLLTRLNSDRPLKTGIVEPTRDAAGLSGLLSMMTAAASTGGETAEQERVGALRALAAGARRCARTCSPSSRRPATPPPWPAPSVRRRCPRRTSSSTTPGSLRCRWRRST